METKRKSAKVVVSLLALADLLPRRLAIEMRINPA
jgi:hypothetical protein